MTSLLSSHLEQISLCAASIADLPFPPPQAFTNALLLHTHDITALIRDTEAHERALFRLAPPPLHTQASDFAGSVGGGAAPAQVTARRATTAYAAAQQPKSKAVAAVLGGDLYRKTRRAQDAAAVTAAGARQGPQKGGEIDVEVLLEGAEKLAAVYPMPGTTDKIAQLRRRHQRLAANIAHYEGRVAEQTRELQIMSRPTSASRSGHSNHQSNEEDIKSAEGEKWSEEEGGEADTTPAIVMTKEDLVREEEEIRELERKKRGLEDRVAGMERDLGGLMR